MNKNIIQYTVLAFLIFGTSAYGIEQNNIHKYQIKNVIKKSWGHLKSVYEQPTSQRLTFESENQITIVEVGLTWNTVSKSYIPDIKQIIEMTKEETIIKAISKKPIPNLSDLN
jgi:hypothetical protein